MSLENYYEILGVSETAGDEEVKQAFRDLAKHFHPDRNPGDEEAERQFKRVNTAYEGLKDASRRQAYNEWLSFAEKRKKVRRSQWGRLAALVCLLLLGPSAVLYWAVVIADIPLFQGQGDRAESVSAIQERSLPPPRPERRPAEASDLAAVPPSETDSAATQEPPPATQASDSGASAVTAEPAQPDNEEIASEAPQPSAPPAERETPPLPPVETAEPAPPPAPPVQTAQPASPPSPPPADETPARDSGGYTQALPERAPEAPPSQAVAENDAEPAAGRNGPPPPERDLSEAEQPSTSPSSARGGAQMLARLKEPDGNLPDLGGRPERGAPPRVQDTALPRQGLPPGTFTDCDQCPIVSVAGSNEALGGAGRAAVSLTEITLADWDGCVADGACRTYERPPAGNRRETVVDVSPVDAEAYARWLSEVTGQPYRHVMSPPRRQAAARGCDSGARGLNSWEWLDGGGGRSARGQDCPEPTIEGQRSFRVFRRVRSGG